MSTLGAKSKSALGFLTVVDHSQQGLFGGYLVLNVAGRPIEFHCTAPIRPNRAQEILYGPTLEPYLYGEQIGRTLLAKSQAKPLVVCTDCEAILAVREHADLPVALVLQGSTNPADGGEGRLESEASQHSQRTWRLDAAHRLCRFELGPNRLAIPAERPDDRQRIADRLAGLEDRLDLSEPFNRIREAIEEARRGG